MVYSATRFALSAIAASCDAERPGASSPSPPPFGDPLRTSPSPTLESVDKHLQRLLEMRHEATAKRELTLVMVLTTQIDEHLVIRKDLMRQAAG